MKKLALTVTLLGLWVTKAIQAAEFFCSSGDVSCLIAAINKANRNGKENTIVLEPGNYVLVAADHIDTDSGATGLPPVSGNITITGVGADSTVIERDAVASTPFRIFSIAVSGNLKFDGITIKGGLNHIDFTGGGGILNRGILTVANSIIFDNQARLGGGIFNLGGTLTIMNSIVLQNTGGGLGDGGGILSVDGTVTVNNSTIASNDVLDGPGGGISNLSVEGIGTMTITNSTISDNFGGDTIGGGITNSGTMTINNSTIARNVASVFFGGGIWNSVLWLS